MKNGQAPNVLIVGAGPVGLSLAVELARRDVPVRVVEKHDGPSTRSKALAVAPRTLETLARLGVVDTFLAAGLGIRGINISTADRPLAHVSFDQLETPYPFILSLPQADTETILADHLRKYGVKVEWNRELEQLLPFEDGVHAVLQGEDGGKETVAAAWVVGCDGAHSKVRDELHLPFQGESYDEIFLIADAQLRGSLPGDELSAFFHPAGALAFIPMSDGQWRVIVSNVSQYKSSRANDPDDASLAEVQRFVDERGPANLQLFDATWTSRFRIARRQAAHYRSGRVLLAGDAAHVCSPAGGQGMNMGIQDAENLAWKLALVIRRRAPESLLDTYEAERANVARRTLKLTDRLTRLITLDDTLLRGARNFLISSMLRFDGVAQRFVANLAELTVNYRRSSLSIWPLQQGVFSRTASPKAGDRAPDAVLTKADGSPLRIYQVMESLQDSQHLLLLFHAGDPTSTSQDAEGPFQPVRHFIERHLVDLVDVVDIVRQPTGMAPVSPFGGSNRLPSQSAHERYEMQSDGCVLVRPDGYIAYRASPPKVDGLRDYFERVLGPESNWATGSVTAPAVPSETRSALMKT